MFGPEDEEGFDYLSVDLNDICYFPEGLDDSGAVV